MDQAGTLRRLGFAEQRYSMIKAIAVASGKGGVGKTNLVANAAYALQKAGNRVLIFDADMGLGNIHILLGVVPKFTIQHVLDGKKRIRDILISGPGGVKILPAGSGNKQFSDLTTQEKLVLIAEMESLQNDFDYILFDIGAGISSTVMYFCSAAQDVTIITTPEPTSFADAYAVMKILSRDYGRKSFHLVVNNAKNRRQAEDVHRRLDRVADHFQLNIMLYFAGHILQDESVQRAVEKQKLVIDQFPSSPAAGCFRQIAEYYTSLRASAPAPKWRDLM